MILAQATQPAAGWDEWAAAWGGVFQAVAALIIGFATYLILTRQSKDAEYKTKLELYKMRYKVYSILHTYLTKIIDETKGNRRKVMMAGYRKYTAAVKQARFLFDTQIADFIGDTYNLLRDMYHIYGELPETLIEPEYYDDEPEIKAKLDRIAKIDKELGRRFGEMPKLFLPYLNFRQVGLMEDSVFQKIRRYAEWINKKMNADLEGQGK